MPRPKIASFDLALVKGRMRLIAALRQSLEVAGYAEMQTPLLQPRLSGFEKGMGFSTYSSALGERLWLRAAPEMYLKRLVIEGRQIGLDKVFELAPCLRDEFDDKLPREGFDRPEFMLLELYAVEDDPGLLESLLKTVIGQAIRQLEHGGYVATKPAQNACAALGGDWQHQRFSDLLRQLDPRFDLENLLTAAWKPSNKRPSADMQAAAIEARATNPELAQAAATLAYKAGEVIPQLRVGPQGYWYDFIDRAFRRQVVPKLEGPVIVSGFPVEASPLAQSDDGVHTVKWEFYLGGVRVALAARELMSANDARVRFDLLDRLRRLGYSLLPEPDEAFLAELERWPADQPLIGMGVYVDRLAGYLFGLLSDTGMGQKRMLPNLFKAQ